MSIKPDDEDVLTASDPILRRATIDDLTKQYRRGCWGIGIILVGLFTYWIFGSKQPNVAVFVVLVVPFMQLYKWESDLRWLQVIDKIRDDEKPVA